MDSERLMDDPAIANDSELWRRIHPNWVVADRNRAVVRVSSAAFDNSPDGSPTSVLLAETMRETGKTADEVIAEFDGYALASITAGQARECEQGVARSPLLDEPAHACVFGDKTKPLKRCLARATRWVIAPSRNDTD